MRDLEQLKQKIEAILNDVPDGVNLEWNFDSASVVWNITQKPVGFTLEDEKKLMSKLNSINNETTMFE